MSDTQTLGNVGLLEINLTTSHPDFTKSRPATTLAYLTIEIPIEDHDAYFKQWNPMASELMRNLTAMFKTKDYAFEGSEYNSSDPWQKWDLGEETRYVGLCSVIPEADEDGVKPIAAGAQDANAVLASFIRDVREVLTAFRRAKAGGRVNDSGLGDGKTP